MDETIKGMVEALKKTGAGYIKIDLCDYAIIVATPETAEFIERAIDVAEEIDEEEQTDGWSEEGRW